MTTRHVMDDFAGGDTAWLQRLNGFQQRETARQVHFKRHHWPGLEDGSDPMRPGETYPYILPSGRERDGLYPGHAGAILACAEDEGLALGERLRDLCSPRAACLNTLFHFRQNRAWAGRVLGPLLPGIARLEQIRFDYGGGEGAAAWLGEAVAGPAGLELTRADAAFEWVDATDVRRLTLAVWTYTDASFGECGGFKAEANRSRERCKNLTVTAIRPDIDCALANGEGPTATRHYWEHLAECGIDLAAFGAVRGCPFRGGLNRLMRLTLLAGWLQRQRATDAVDVAVLAFQHNRSLLLAPRGMKGAWPGRAAGMPDVWNSALSAGPAVRLVLVESLMKGVDGAGGADPHWRGYVRERYGL